MASQTQIAPGKRRIASNALKQALYSDTRINEGHNFVRTLLTDLQAEYRPITATEYILVQQLAIFQTRFLRAQSHYLSLIDIQAEAMYLDRKKQYQIDPDMDSRYALAFAKQSQSNYALEILNRQIESLPNKIRKAIEMLVWYRKVPAAKPAEIEEQTQIEREMPRQARTQRFPALDVDISLEEFNRAIIEAVELHGLHTPQEAKERLKTEIQTQFLSGIPPGGHIAPKLFDNQQTRKTTDAILVGNSRDAPEPPSLPNPLNQLRPHHLAQRLPIDIFPRQPRIRRLHHNTHLRLRRRPRLRHCRRHRLLQLRVAHLLRQIRLDNCLLGRFLLGKFRPPRLLKLLARVHPLLHQRLQ